MELCNLCSSPLHYCDSPILGSEVDAMFSIHDFDWKFLKKLSDKPEENGHWET
jgi:hypothetical protein